MEEKESVDTYTTQNQSMKKYAQNFKCARKHMQTNSFKEQ